MHKKILVLSGSPRKHGNSDRLSDEFIRGAEEVGHKAEKIYICKKNIHACLGCCTCQRNGGNCIQKDEMNELYEKMKNVDIIVFAFPVYFYTWNAQMKTIIDRTIAVEELLTNKTFYMISSGQAPKEKYMDTMIDSFRKYISCFQGEGKGNKEGGYVFGYATDKVGDVVGTPAMAEAYEMGKDI